MAVCHGWPIKQLDVQNAFLNGELSEVVHMIQPPGYEDPLWPDHVCRLNKTIYGLKQSPRAWYNKLSSYLIKLGFINSKADASIFFRITSSAILIILIYVDDILITGSDESLIKNLMSTLSEVFSLKELGDLSYFLGIQVARNKELMHLRQEKYIKELLRKVQLEDCMKKSTTRMQSP